MKSMNERIIWEPEHMGADNMREHERAMEREGAGGVKSGLV